MPFTGKSTYDAGSDLPEIVEDVSDIIGIVSPFETPLLDHLGDAKRAAQSTIHEWLEDTLLPNTDTLNQTVFTPDPQSASSLTAAHGDRFRVGDLVRAGDNSEIMLVTAVSGNTLTVTRTYGGTAAATLANGMKLFIVGNAALEGDAASAARFTSRVRKRNYTQILSSTVTVSGSMQAARQHGIADEVDFQKQERLRELLRDLENCVINGVAPTGNPQGSSTVRRSMQGIVKSIATNIFVPDAGGIPPGGGGSGDELTEEVLNACLRAIWDQSSARVDTIVVNGAQKRRINGFATGARSFSPGATTFRDLISVYESDFGVCRVVLSRWVPAGMALLLDSSRIDVLPLRGRSFHFKPLAATGDATNGQVIGEYTVEFRNEAAHGLITGLSST
ncbi:MAG: DUF5309 family protein [Phycisphaerales bacterium]